MGIKFNLFNIQRSNEFEGKCLCLYRWMKCERMFFLNLIFLKRLDKLDKFLYLVGENVLPGWKIHL